jgi:hypothetical protein
MRHQLSGVINQISPHRERLGRQWYAFIRSVLPFAPETFLDEISRNGGNASYTTPRSYPVLQLFHVCAGRKLFKNRIRTERKRH